jgi:hypothetical protein
MEDSIMENKDEILTEEEATAIINRFTEKLMKLTDEHPEMFVPIDIEQK